MAAACATTGNNDGRESLLISAGFKARLATTPQQQAHLNSLPANTITQVVKNGKTYYVLAEPLKNQVLVGTPGQYQYYQQLKKERNAAQQDYTEARSNADTAGAWNVWGDWENDESLFVLKPGLINPCQPLPSISISGFELGYSFVIRASSFHPVSPCNLHPEMRYRPHCTFWKQPRPRKGIVPPDPNTKQDTNP